MSQAHPTDLSGYIHENNILCGLELVECPAVIELLAKRLHENEGGFDCDEVVKACMDCERGEATLLAPGLALPHARVAGLDSLRVGIALARRGVAFQCCERESASVLVMVLTPKDKPGLHLQFLAALAQRLGAPEAVARLTECAGPAEVVAFLREEPAELPPFLQAHNVMDTNVVTVLESASVAETMHVMFSNRLYDVPVVDEEGDLRGLVSLEDILKMCLPQHLAWMEDLTPILRFEPFAELLRQEKDSKVADFMREDYLSVGLSVPAMQLAKLFLSSSDRQIMIVEGRRLRGTVEIRSFMSKILWA